ncbi:hypothetical protein ACF08N_10045 [Streptomyces sp. NPDC015127]|uniref:hypothetical protein n=1 Tax=Streptomyces sp. NPDC015127 TaxID=3364939 RepID=UPI00370114AA
MTTMADGSTPASADGRPQRLRAEIERLRDEAARQRALAHRRAEFWTVVDIALGFPAAILAATAGAAGLATADARIPAAVLALASAGFAAGSGFLRSDTRRIGNKRARQAWAALEGRATVKLAQEELTPEDLGELLHYRHAALAAYEGEDPQPPALGG